MISWTFEQHQENGLPTEEQSELLQDFEDSLLQELDPDRTAILAFVYSSAGLREWHFYVGDMDDVGRRINSALSDKPALPIDLTAHDDSDWSELLSVLRDAGDC
jgi:hypothetical protein